MSNINLGVISFYEKQKDSVPTQGSNKAITSGGLYNTLTNYYNKSQIDDKIALIKQFDYTIENSLPTASAETMYKIYFVPSTTSIDKNTKDEFITVYKDGNYSWEQIGSSVVDTEVWTFVLDNDETVTKNVYVK